MQLPQPYLFTSERMIGLVDRPHMRPLPGEGLISDTVFGYHTLWAAEVPFIPALSERKEKASGERIAQVLQRHMRFLAALAGLRGFSATFELRLVFWPRPDRQAKVSMAFLGKTFHPDQAISRQQAFRLWDTFCALFPTEAPFSYPLVPVQYLDKAVSAETHSFQQWFEPLPWQDVSQPQSIVELRKYEDWPTVRDIGGTLHIRDYIPHPFRPAEDFSALPNLLTTLARQQQICLVAITLRPQALTAHEIVILHEMADWYRQRAKGEAPIDNPASAVLSKFKSNVFEAYMRPRAEFGQQVYENIIREHHSLFLARIQVAGLPFVQHDVVETLGSTLIANRGESYPSQWMRAIPRPEDFRAARFNLQWLEFARWGISPLLRQDRRFIRLGQLATVYEIAGLFCLPVAPAEGRLAGVEVRDEPFPARLPSAPGEIALGTVLDHGVPTSLPGTLSREALAGISVLLGRPGAARTRVMEHLLEGAREIYLPCIHIAASTQRELTELADQWPQRLLIDAAGPRSAQTLLVCHPFLPPPGCSLARFQEGLLHILGRVSALPMSAMLALRQALRETYLQAGWTDECAGEIISPGDLAEQIEKQIREQGLPGEAAAQAATDCILPLHDLAEHAAWLFRAGAQEWTPAESLLVEVGWVGSDLSNRLLRGCLWAWFSQALSVPGKEASPPRALLSLDEAHLFFSAIAARTSSAHTFSLMPLLTRQIAQGSGVLLLSDRGDLLAHEIYERAALMLLTRQERAGMLKPLETTLDLSSRQFRRLAHLQSEELALIMHHAEVCLVLIS